MTNNDSSNSIGAFLIATVAIVAIVFIALQAVKMMNDEQTDGVQVTVPGVTSENNAGN